MKILSAAFFLSVGLAVGTVISTMFADPAPVSDVRVQPDSTEQATAAVGVDPATDHSAPDRGVAG